MTSPNLSHQLFWDVDYGSIEWQEKYRFVIERVLERGTFSDWLEIKRYYGLEKIKNTVLQARWLDNTTLSFCSNYFHTPKEQFRCYMLKSSNPAPWVF
ncbi:MULTISPECIES: hypothetical protein [unclassified Spirosoma]|uniref:DUF6922 domain-containing protein n=1 Tax=unclassified Spirosoma TaxID=2621999 RepID=UPI00096141EE|nr:MULTISPECIES: hypothetical protein [unclassified Spirosoma]MBN8823999.1 hypothetical protein [Spirosoma sp.]OJW70410.1 MAG: hypothetical protein BGO59_24420 [Spirosoma sp. 48-14]